MELEDFLKIVKTRKNILLSAWLILLLIGLTFTFLQPLKYAAASRLLIVQSTSNSDPYTISKSNQYLGTLFSQVVYSESFFRLTMNSNFDIEKNYFGDSQRKQVETWKKTITVRNVGETGILEMNIYHPDPEQAKQIALATNNILITQGFNYQGNNNIQIRIIDQPLLSKFPVKPNIIFNLIAFSLLGLISGLIYIYIFPTKKKRIKIIKIKNQKIHKEIVKDNSEKVDSREETEQSKKIEGNIQNVLNKFN